MNDDLQFLAGFIYRWIYEPGSITVQDGERLSAISQSNEPKTARKESNK